MLLSIIFWIIVGSGLLWLCLANLLGIVYAVSLIKRMLWKDKPTKVNK